MIDLARRVLPAADAADVVDAAITDIWERRKLARYQGRSTLGTWLGAIALNAALNARRTATARGRTIVDRAASTDPAVSAAAGECDDLQLAAVLSEAIAALPPASKVLVLMYYEQNLTLDEAAVVLGRSKSTLSRALTAARERIRETAARLARERFGATLEALREGADLGQLDLDLRDACGGGRDRVGPRVSNS
jgi:RNA polymerase sigma factor (sigma-70 family)